MTSYVVSAHSHHTTYGQGAPHEAGARHAARLAAYAAWCEAEAARYDFWDALAVRTTTRANLRRLHRDGACRIGAGYVARRVSSPALTAARQAVRAAEKRVMGAEAVMEWWEDTALECWAGFIECADDRRDGTADDMWAAFLACICGDN